MSPPRIHPTAVIEEGAVIGDGARIWHFVHVSEGARVGARCSLGQNVFVGRGVRLGDGVKVQNNVSIYEGVEIEDEVFLGPSCVFTNVVNPRAFIERKAEYRPTPVRRGATIGANATILCGNEIGSYALVGAGAVVTRSVPAFGLVVGNPARRVGWVCKCGVRLPDGERPVCAACGAGYFVEGERCQAATDEAREGAHGDGVARGHGDEGAAHGHGDEGAARGHGDEGAARGHGDGAFGGSEGQGHSEAKGTPAATGGVDEGPIPLVDVQAQNAAVQPRIQAAIERVVRSGHFILGEEVARFEEEIAAHLGVAHAIGVSSGTDALLVALMALGIGPGDEVVTTPYSFFATAGVIARVGATPVFADVGPGTLNLDPEAAARAIGPRTKAILPVHLFGRACAMEALRAIADRHGLPIIEDAAQAIGARAEIGPVGGIGTIGSFSFFPSKNLGALGDAGLVTTNDPRLAEEVQVLRAHGAKPKYHHARIGGNFRLDALQAAVLREKLPCLPGWTAARRRNAELYTRLFREADLPEGALDLPPPGGEDHVWNQYVIRTPRRDALRAHLTRRGIATEVYYPVPLHRQPCFAHLGLSEGSLPVAERASHEALAIPVFPELGEPRVRRIVRAVVEGLRADGASSDE